MNFRSFTHTSEIIFIQIYIPQKLSFSLWSTLVLFYVLIPPSVRFFFTYYLCNQSKCQKHYATVNIIFNFCFYPQFALRTVWFIYLSLLFQPPLTAFLSASKQFSHLQIFDTKQAKIEDRKKKKIEGTGGRKEIEKYF